MAIFFFLHELTIFWLAEKWCKDTFFPILHHLSPVIFENTTMAFLLLRNSTFSFHCYTQCEAMPPQKSAWKWRCNLSRLLAWKITKGIHLCKPASLKHDTHLLKLMIYCFILVLVNTSCKDQFQFPPFSTICSELTTKLTLMVDHCKQKCPLKIWTDVFNVKVTVSVQNFNCLARLTPKGGRGCLMSTPCLESLGCHLIPLSYLLSCFSA